MFYFFRKCSWCRDLGSSGPKNQHSLEEHFFNLATTNSILAPVRPARLQRWLPRRAKPSLHGSWRRTGSKCHGHWAWNDKSTMRIPELPQHKPGSPWKNWWLPTTSQLYFFGLCTAQSLFTTVPKLQFLRKHCWHQMTRTPSKNKFWTLPQHL